MRFVKQQMKISVRNIDDSINSSGTSKKHRHSDLLPNSIRCIIAGPSNCGKTNLLVSMIESEHGLKFENIYIYSKTLEQDKYKYLGDLQCDRQLNVTLTNVDIVVSFTFIPNSLLLPYFSIDGVY